MLIHKYKINKKNITMKNYSTLSSNTYRNLKSMDNYEKETLIYKLFYDLELLNKQVINLTQKNIEQNKLLKDYKELKVKVKKYEEELKLKDIEKFEIIKKKDDKNSELFKKINFLENTVSINRINYDKNNILYQQKMSAFKYIQKENQIYAEEKSKFEEEKKKYEQKKEEEIENIKVITDLKYERFKKKMDEDLIKFNENLVNENSEYIASSHRMTILQNKQLYFTIETLEKRIEELENKNFEYKNRIFVLEKDLEIEKKLSKDLSQKIENNKIIRLTRNKSDLMTTGIDNNTNNFNNSNSIYSKIYSIDNKANKSIEKRLLYYKRLIEEKNNEKEKMILSNSHLKNKLSLYQNKFKGLFNFFEEAINNFCCDEEIIKNENFYLKLEKIRNCDFNDFSKSEKYALLVLLMKYLLPLIDINFNSSSNIGKNLFKTNLNIINNKFNLNETFLKDETLRNAFIDKKNKFFKDVINPQRTHFSSSVPVLKKFKGNKFFYFEDKNKAII